MDRLVIRGGKPLEGSVQICGAKNAALPQIAASLLSTAPLELSNVPDVIDVTTMLGLMGEFGVVATRGPGRMLVLDASGAHQAERRTIWFGACAPAYWYWPLLARFGSARVSLPGAAVGATDRSSLKAWRRSVPRLTSGRLHPRANQVWGLRGVISCCHRHRSVQPKRH